MIERIQQSTATGNVLFAFGGNAILENFRTPFVTAVNEELNKKSFQLCFFKKNYLDFLNKPVISPIKAPKTPPQTTNQPKCSRIIFATNSFTFCGVNFLSSL